MTPGPRTRRAGAVVLLLLVALAAAALGVLVTAWCLVAVPVAAVAAYGAWLGLSNEELGDALTGAGDDPGHGPAGMSP